MLVYQKLKPDIWKTNTCIIYCNKPTVMAISYVPQIFTDNMYVIRRKLSQSSVLLLYRMCSDGKFHSSPDAVPLFSKALLRVLYQKDLFTMGGK